MSQYKAEVLFVDKDGKKYPAKITGYTLDGVIAQPVDSESQMPTASADHLKKKGIKTFVKTPDKPDGEWVEIKNFRCQKDRKYNAVKVPVGQPEPDSNFVYTPFLSVLVNYGNSKRGEVWREVMNVTFPEYISRRESSAPKQYLELLPETAKVSK